MLSPLPIPCKPSHVHTPLCFVLLATLPSLSHIHEILSVEITSTLLAEYFVVRAVVPSARMGDFVHVRAYEKKITIFGTELSREIASSSSSRQRPHESQGVVREILRSETGQRDARSVTTPLRRSCRSRSTALKQTERFKACSSQDLDPEATRATTTYQVTTIETTRNTRMHERKQ